MERTLKKIVLYAAAIAEPEKIILFGSMADKKGTDYSDIDLLIISNIAEGKKDIANMIESYSSELSLKSDILIYSELEIKKETMITDSFLGGIIKSGKVVYKKRV